MCSITLTVSLSHVRGGGGGIVCNSNTVQTKIFVKLKRFQIHPSLKLSQPLETTWWSNSYLIIIDVNGFDLDCFDVKPADPIP